MKHKIFYAWLMIVFFAFVSFGGCGSSSSDSGSSRRTASSVSMKEAFDSDDIKQEIVSQVVSNDLILAGLLEVKIYQLSVSGDGNILMEDASFTEETQAPALYDPYELRRHYDSEDVIILAEADIDFINRVRTDLGESAEDPSIVGESGWLEVYAMSRISTGNSFRLYTYTVPTMNDIIYSEGTPSQQETSQYIIDILSGDEPISDDEIISGDYEALYTAVDFVVERWMNLFEWISSFGIRNIFIDVLSEDIAADADGQTHTSEFVSSAKFSAAGALAEDADRKDHTLDFSYTGLTAEGITHEGWNNAAMAFTMSRTNKLNLKVYSAHSFKTGNDYYYVQSSAYTNPNNYKKATVAPITGSSAQYLYGYTKYLGFEAWLDGSTADNVALIAANPANLKGSPVLDEAKYTGTTSHDIISWAGVHQYTGPYAIDGASYSNSQTWKPYGWDMVNNCGANHASSAGWYADVYLPASMWGTLIPAGEATSMLSYTTDWVWEVKPDFWKSNKTVKLNIDFDVRDGATTSSFERSGTTYDRADKWFGNKQTASIVLTPPPHVAAKLVGRSLSSTVNSLALASYNLAAHFNNKPIVVFSYTLDEKPDTLTLKVLAEEDWTLSYKTSDGGNWATLSETSGKATGANPKDIVITLEENKTGIRMLQIDIQSGQDHAAVNILQNK